MKISVSESLCSGHGRCYTVAPEVYESDEEGFNALRGETVEVEAGKEEAARRGADSCPESAITIS